MKQKTISLFVIIVLLANCLFAQHLKRNGTPDMRFKENRTTLSTDVPNNPPSSVTNTHYNSSHQLKEDGTPDMRYKNNKTRTSIYPSTSNFSTPAFTYSPLHKKLYKHQYHITKTLAPIYPVSSNYSYNLSRNANGKIKRSEGARLAFMKSTGFPNGRPGYIIDHIIPLKRAGCDCPGNMQWQTIADAKAKDKWE